MSWFMCWTCQANVIIFQVTLIDSQETDVDGTVPNEDRSPTLVIGTSNGMDIDVCVDVNV